MQGEHAEGWHDQAESAEGQRAEEAEAGGGPEGGDGAGEGDAEEHDPDAGEGAGGGEEGAGEGPQGHWRADAWARSLEQELVDGGQEYGQAAGPHKDARPVDKAPGAGDLEL